MRAGAVAALLAALASAAPALVSPVAALGAPRDGMADLAGTSWRLVQYSSMDGSVVAPDDRSKYTLIFGADGKLSARLDCDRGNGTWAAPGAHELRLGPMALTRAACPPGSLHDRMVRDWSMIRSYTLKNDHLFLALMADAGVYEFEPLSGAPGSAAAPPAAAPGPASPPPPGEGGVASKGPIDYECDRAGGGHEAVRATFYQTSPALVLVERKKQVRPAFQVTAASGARYEGDELLFWEAHGEARVTWSEIALTCRPRGEPAPKEKDR